MSAPRLPSSALWEAVQALSQKELTYLRRQVEGTRLSWLLDTLRQLPAPDEHALRKIYTQTFPQADPKLIKVYKRQLWDLLEATLPTLTPEFQRRQRLWQRLWLSFLLWQRGLASTAEVLWRQVAHDTIQQGEYELALWSLSLLELYWRDMHRAAPSLQLSKWCQQLLQLLTHRYTALSQKIAASETYILTRRPGGWTLPPLPEEDPWATYMQAYAQLVEKAADSQFEAALRQAVYMLELLSHSTPLPEPYHRYHLAFTWNNIGILLLNLRETTLYEAWYEAWNAAWRQSAWPDTWSYQLLHYNALAAHLGYLIQTCQWEVAQTFYQTHRQALHELIFDSTANLGFRLGTACNVYLVLLLTAGSHQEPIQWRLKVENWIQREGVEDIELLWWTFLRWYEAYRSGAKTWIRHWYRKLRALWKRRFTEHFPWRYVLRFLWSLSEGVSFLIHRKARALLRRWQHLPEERAYWENNSVFFPMLPFVETTLHRLPLERIKPVSWPPHIDSKLRETLQGLIYSMPHKIAPKSCPSHR